MMKSMMFALAALAAFQAAAITATKEYVDRKTGAIVSNTYTKAETDAAVAALSNAVPSIVTNEIDLGFSEWELHGIPDNLGIKRYGVENPVYTLFFDPLHGGLAALSHDGMWDEDIMNSNVRDPEATFVQLYNYTGIGGQLDITATRRRLGTQNTLGLARLKDVPNIITNTVTKEYVEGLGIGSGIQEESDPVWVGDKPNYATKQSVTVVSNIAASADTKANTLISYVNGDDVMDVVTNYDSVVHISSRSLRQRVEDGGSNVWRVVWDEMNRWNWFLPQIEYQTNALWSALSEKADRAWGFYDSHTGGWSPDGYTQISSPKILIAAGMAYQRHVVTGGAVWLLESNGLDTEVGGVASNGFFRISDDDGNALFEIVKGNKRTIGSTAGALAATNIMGVTHLYITYAVEAAEHPTIEATYALGSAFVSEESAGSLVNVTWTGSSGDWHAEVWPKVVSSSLFVRASHEVGGETYIKNTAPTGLDGGIMYNGVKYRVVPYSSGGKTYLTLEEW